MSSKVYQARRKYDHGKIKAKLSEGLSYEQVSRIFGCSVAVVRSCKSEMVGDQNAKSTDVTNLKTALPRGAKDGIGK